MDNIDQACIDRWCALASLTNLIKMEKEAGMSTLAEKVRARDLLFELRLYHDSGLMPEQVRREYERQIDPKIERLLH